MIVRKIIIALVTACIMCTGLPASLSAKEKSKTHKTHKQRKALRKQRKRYEHARKWSNDFREPRNKHVGDHMYKKQTPKEQKKRRKFHLKAEGGHY